MRSNEIRGHGARLAERVGEKVDTDQRLNLMMKAHKRGRVVSAATAVAVAVAILVGLIILADREPSPVVTVPPTTAPAPPDLQPLPVELFVVLRGAITVDADGVCAGTGPLEGMAEGATLTIREAVDGAPREVATLPLPPGEVVSSDDPEAVFIPLRGHPTACVFPLPDPGYDLADYDRLDLDPEIVPPNGYSVSLAGQRVFVVLDSSDQP